MAKIRIIVGSETGTALDVADAVEAALSQQGHQIAICQSPSLSDLTNDESETLLICTSSCGAGELPSNIRPLHRQLLDTPPTIAGRHYAVISLGDSSFDTYGGAAKTLDDALADIGAVRIGDPLMLDAMETLTPDKDAAAWAKEWVQTL